jgi:hypothetical protein
MNKRRLFEGERGEKKLAYYYFVTVFTTDTVQYACTQYTELRGKS